MVFSSEELKIISQLNDMVDELYRILDMIGEDTVQRYQSLHKIKNILKSKDPKGMKNVKHHLMMDFRMIDDRQLESVELDNIIDRIYNHVISNGIFNVE